MEPKFYFPAFWTPITIIIFYTFPLLWRSNTNKKANKKTHMKKGVCTRIIITIPIAVEFVKAASIWLLVYYYCYSLCLTFWFDVLELWWFNRKKWVFSCLIFTFLCASLCACVFSLLLGYYRWIVFENPEMEERKKNVVKLIEFRCCPFHRFIQ